MKLNTITLLMLSALSTTAHADWFFRGTSNNWAAKPLTAAGNNTFTTCETFAAGDSDGGPRFKIDRFGNWAESYPSTDYSAQSHRSYRVTFTSTTQNISIEEVATCDSPSEGFTKNFSQLHIRGTINSWIAQPMQLIADNTWEINVTFDGQTDQRFKFDIHGDWAQNYGDNNSDGVLESAGNDIFYTGTGNATITVNDQTLAYSISGSNPPPPPEDSWYFRGTANNWVATPMLSDDGINFCTEQAFGSTNPRFKIDHFGDWIEAYPTEDYAVSPDSEYRICFDAGSKTISTTLLGSQDNQAPNVSATPPAGNYTTSQQITLSISDNVDSAPTLYFTTDGSPATTSANVYSGETFSATDNTAGIDLSINTLAVDASGNQSTQRFDYRIGDVPSGNNDFREETIYFLLTARFYDGDSSNNYYNRDRYKAGDPHWRGDFKGLIQQLDYIKDLGFTAIWVTPPVENRSGLDYHGYHAYDFYKIDPRLESADASYQDFINAAHAKGLKVIQDVVINHSSQYGIRGQVWIDHLPIKYYVPAGGAQGQIDNGLYQGHLGDYSTANRDDNDNPVAPAWFRERHNSDPTATTPLIDPQTGETVPKAGYNPNRFFGIDAQRLDPNWYHLDGFMAGGDWENPLALQRKHMAGDTIDLATENQQVKDYLNGAIHQYLDMGVDAIRVDTLKHIERDELLGYIHDWQAHKPGLFVFGENLVKGTGWGSEIANDNASAVIRPWYYTRTTQDPSNPNAGGDSGLSVLDFSLFSTFRDNVTRGNLGGVGGILGMDWIYGDATKLITFFQNHDVGPDNDFKYRYGGEEANAALVYNLMWTIRGIPTLYYGEEIQFQAGLPQDIANANDTIDQTGRAYFGPHLDDLATTQAHPLYQHIKRLNQIRQQVPALQKAAMSNVNEWGAGMSFVRELSQANSYAVVGLAASGSQNITVSNIQNGTYRDAVTGASITVNNGSMSFNVPAYSARIWVLNGPGKIGVDGKYLK